MAKTYAFDDSSGPVLPRVRRRWLNDLKNVKLADLKHEDDEYLVPRGRCRGCEDREKRIRELEEKIGELNDELFRERMRI